MKGVIFLPLTDKNEITNKIILVKEVIAKLQHFSKLYGIKSIFIVGGYSRSYYLGKLWTVNDIDVASAFKDQALQLGGLFASEILNSTPRFYERTGTAMMEYVSDQGSIKVEFQGNSTKSYMQNEEVRTWMQSKGIEDVPLMNNIYGRDFTINSLIYSLHNEQLYDPTNRGIPDFEKKKIVSLLPANILIKYNPLASLRAIRFALKYDFYIEESLRTAIKSAGIENLTQSLTKDRILKEVVNVLKTSPDGLDMLKMFKLDRILLDPSVKDYLYLGSRS